MKAFVVKGHFETEVVEVPIPKLRPEFVRVKVEYVALNPTDWKNISRGYDDGRIIGCDVAGVVEEVGAEAKSGVKKGDRIAGLVNGSNKLEPGNGGFAEYANLKDGLFIQVPEHLGMAEASTLGVGITTVGQALYQSLELPFPTTPAKTRLPLLIYGGSTATGTLAIQFAKLSNLEVTTTSSPHNFQLLTSLGADKCFDYKNADCGEEIRKYTHDDLCHVFDCISSESSAAISAAALSNKPTPAPAPSEEGKKLLLYTGLVGLPSDAFPRDDVDTRRTLAYTANGEDLDLGAIKIPARPEDYEFGKKFWALASELFAQGKLKVHPVDLGSGGLSGIFDGLMAMKDNKVSGKKLVYKIV